MSLKLFTCQGGRIILPSSVLVSRQDGGNLWNPRGKSGEKRLTPVELSVVFLNDSHRQSYAGCPASTAGGTYQLF